jgi:hypothetical protein
MDRDEQLLGLYLNLRGEIQHADAQNYQVLAFTVAATAALITAGVGQDRPVQQAVVFGLVYLVTWPCQRILQGNRRRIWRIATYLRVVIEPQLDGVRWESHLARVNARLTRRQRNATSTKIVRSEWLVVVILNLTAGLCIVGFPVLSTEIPTAQKIGAAAGTLLVNVLLSGVARYQDAQLRRRAFMQSLFDEVWSDLPVPEGRGSLTSALASRETTDPEERAQTP